MVVESLRGTKLTEKPLTRHVCLLLAEPFTSSIYFHSKYLGLLISPFQHNKNMLKKAI
jgi:hypothetical protein